MRVNTPYRMENVTQDSFTKKAAIPIRNAGLRWAAIGGVVLGFLGVMKITGNLNRFFFAELIMLFPGSKASPIEIEDESKKTLVIPPGSEATITVKNLGLGAPD